MNDAVVGPVHRLGGGGVENLRPAAAELGLTPPGISVFLGGGGGQALEGMRRAYPRSRKWQSATAVGTADLTAVWAAGFDVIADPTAKFPNHGRLVHPDGAAGFTDANLARLAAAFDPSTGG